MKRKPLKMVSIISTIVNSIILLFCFILALIFSKDIPVMAVLSPTWISCVLVSVSSFIVTYIDYSKTQNEEGKLIFGRLMIAANIIIFLAANALYVIYGI